MANIRLIAIAGGLVAAAAVGWIALQEPEKVVSPIPVESQPSSASIMQPERPPEADIPVRIVAEPSIAPEPQLPTLDESDSWLREQSVDLVASNARTTLGEWLSASDLLRRSSAYIDGLSRGQLLTNIFALSPPSERFISHTSNGSLWMNAGNYERYNATVDVLSAINPEQLANLFHRARPLLMAAFSELGYTQRQMDGVVIAALDEILATPVIVEPIELTRESVAFRFADEQLESLSRLQKQLLRSGPENTRRLQDVARQLREQLLAE